MSSDDIQVAGLSLMSGLVLLWEKIVLLFNLNDVDVVAKIVVTVLTIALHSFKLRQFVLRYCRTRNAKRKRHVRPDR